MRKLILIGIISVVGIIVWISYLKYDVNRFIDELPRLPTSGQQSDSISGGADPLTDVNTDVNSVTTSDTTTSDMKKGSVQNKEGVLDVSTLVLQKDSTSLIKSSNTITLEDRAESDLISAEIESFFVAYTDNYQQQIKVNDKLNPISMQYASLVDQLQGLATGPADSEITGQLIKQIEEVGHDLFPLQEERDRIYKEFLILLGEQGFESKEEFELVYGDIYELWKANR